MSEWISVKDRLPEENADVLLYLEHEMYKEARIFIGYWTFGYRKIKYWHSTLQDYDYTPMEVKNQFWQPLPEAPKGE